MVINSDPKMDPKNDRFMVINSDPKMDPKNAEMRHLWEIA
jgi:hypothetical protein